jgi:hypothetical protein
MESNKGFLNHGNSIGYPYLIPNGINVIKKSDGEEISKRNEKSFIGEIPLGIGYG